VDVHTVLWLKVQTVKRNDLKREPITHDEWTFFLLLFSFVFPVDAALFKTGNCFLRLCTLFAQRNLVIFLFLSVKMHCSLLCIYGKDTFFF